MLSRGCRTLTPLAAVFAALLLSSCGGSMGDSVTGPSPIDMPADSSDLRVADVQLDDLDLDGLSASSADKVLICHKGKESLWVSSSAVPGHQGHGDILGECGAAATCPCFSQADIDAAASGCSSLTAFCPATYSLGLFCNTTTTSAGYWEAVVGQNSCTWTVGSITETRPVDAGQFEACRVAITSSALYPPACPR